MQILWYKNKKIGEWVRVNSPNGTYGIFARGRGLQGYKEFLEKERGKETKVTEENSIEDK